MADLHPDNYAQWLSHPVSKIYFQYLLDYRDSLKEVAFNALVDGKLDEGLRDVIQGRANTLAEMANLEFSHMRTFYGVEPEERKEDEGKNS